MNAQVQFIDFEGRSDGESLLKILSQLRPRRVIVVRGASENVNLISKHCSQSIGARVFTPNKGDIIDATTENHIYQVKLTEALIAKLQFQKVKDAEVAWVDAKIRARSKKILPSNVKETDSNLAASNGSNSNSSPSMDIDNDEEDDISNGDVAVLNSSKNCVSSFRLCYLSICMYVQFTLSLQPITPNCWHWSPYLTKIYVRTIQHLLMN